MTFRYNLLLFGIICVTCIALNSPKEPSYEINVQEDEQDYFDEFIEDTESDNKQPRNEVNDFVDGVVKNMNQYIVDLERDPVELPEEINEFEWQILLIRYQGELSYSEGWLKGLANIKRRASARITEDGDDTIITMPLKYSILQFRYNYKAKFLNFGPQGSANGYVSQTKFLLQLRVDPQWKISLEKFTFRKIGYTTVKFTGNLLVDWLANIFSIVTTPYLKPTIRETLAEAIMETINKLIIQHNRSIGIGK